MRALLGPLLGTLRARWAYVCVYLVLQVLMQAAFHCCTGITGVSSNVFGKLFSATKCDMPVQRLWFKLSDLNSGNMPHANTGYLGTCDSGVLKTRVRAA